MSVGFWVFILFLICATAAGLLLSGVIDAAWGWSVGFIVAAVVLLFVGFGIGTNDGGRALANRDPNYRGGGEPGAYIF